MRRARALGTLKHVGDVQAPDPYNDPLTSEDVDPGVAEDIAQMYGIPIEWAESMFPVAFAVGGNPYHLARVINAESRFDPEAVNPRSGATGLIQFMPSTASKLGFTIPEIAAMDFFQQMDLVSYYLQLVGSGGWAGPAGALDNQYKMALAVFYPAWRNKPPETLLPANVQRLNPGIRTVGDYVTFVLKSSAGHRHLGSGVEASGGRPPTPKPKPSSGGGPGMLLGLLFFGVVGTVALSRATR